VSVSTTTVFGVMLLQEMKENQPSKINISWFVLGRIMLQKIGRLSVLQKDPISCPNNTLSNDELLEIMY
jgi:hypothetical protein